MTIAGWILMVLIGTVGSLLTFLMFGWIRANFDRDSQSGPNADRLDRSMRNALIGACVGIGAILAVWIGAWLLDGLPEGLAWLGVALGAILIDFAGIAILLGRSDPPLESDSSTDDQQD